MFSWIQFYELCNEIFKFALRIYGQSKENNFVYSKKQKKKYSNWNFYLYLSVKTMVKRHFFVAFKMYITPRSLYILSPITLYKIETIDSQINWLSIWIRATDSMGLYISGLKLNTHLFNVFSFHKWRTYLTHFLIYAQFLENSVKKKSSNSCIISYPPEAF